MVKDGGRRGKTGEVGGGRVATLGLLVSLTSLLTFPVLPRPSPSFPVQSREVLLATTTSTRDAGLLDSLLPLFEQRTGYRVKVIAVGSGQALETGRRGDADVVLAHAPDAERALADSGYFVNRRLVMHNDFLIVGPARDPAGLRGLNDALAAVRRIAAQRATFISRGDQSGTHKLEQLLWKQIGLAPPAPGGWYVESGQGMAATLQMADEKRGYTITDRATYLAWRDKIQLVPQVEGDPILYNVYHVMEVNPKNAPRVNTAGARALADFLVAPETQARIGEFGKSRFGQSLFVPDAGKQDRW
jgi:tungstate transport system substrate-binding protein